MIEGAGGAPASPSISQEVAHLFAALVAVRERPLGGLSGDAIAADLAELCRARNIFDLAVAETTRAYHGTDHAEVYGYHHPVGFLREACHVATGPAVAAQSVGSELPRLPLFKTAVEEGAIGFAHLAEMAHVVQAVDEHWRPADEVRMLRKAKDLTVTAFRKACEHFRHQADAERFNREQADDTESCRLKLSGGTSGPVWLSGVFPAAEGAVVRTALESIAVKRGPDDDRLREVRLAHALVEICEHALDGGLAPRRGGVRPHLQVTTTLETLMALPGAPAGELEYSLPISARTVQRLACDCSLTRVLLGADSVVIDVGRSKRLVDGSPRKALYARDRHCRWPGCDRPGSWCTPHHLVHWAAGGSTDLSNQILLCAHHHWRVHEAHWQIVVAEDGRVLTIPPVDLYCRGPDSSEAA
jgi:hypothetical protein